MSVKTPLKITDTTLRDAHQSLLATRWRVEDMLPIARKIDEIGTKGGPMGDLTGDMDKAIDLFYKRRDDPEDKKLLLEKIRDKKQDRAKNGSAKTARSPKKGAGKSVRKKAVRKPAGEGR